MDANALRMKVGIHERSARDFFDALVALGMLARKDGKYANSPETDLYLDKAKPNLLHDEITTVDNALTRPWTVKKSYIRVEGQRATWREWICAEGNSHVEIGGQPYFLSAEGLLMPTKRGQAPPDLRYFTPSAK